MNETNQKTAADASTSSELYKENANYALMKTKTIIDLNAIGKNSLLSEHYLLDSENESNLLLVGAAAAATNHRRRHRSTMTMARRLTDLRLSDAWPRSSMCKIGQKASPWVRAQREKSFAIEFNSYFHDLAPLPPPPPELLAASSSCSQPNTSLSPVATHTKPMPTSYTSLCILPSVKNTKVI